MTAIARDASAACHRFSQPTAASVISILERPPYRNAFFIATAMEAATMDPVFFDQYCFGRFYNRQTSCSIAVRWPDTKPASLQRPRPRQRHNR
jgi:hypothetical protein